MQARLNAIADQFFADAHTDGDDEMTHDFARRLAAAELAREATGAESVTVVLDHDVYLDECGVLPSAAAIIDRIKGM